MSENTFRYLLRHEFRLELRKFFQKKWMAKYGGVIVLLLAAALTVWKERGGFRTEYLLYLAYMLPYLTFMISFRVLLREWKNGTVGWWITLPYSRSTLLLAKFGAAFLHMLLVYVLFFGSLTLLVLYNAAVHGLGTAPLHNLFAGEAVFATVLLGLAPFMLALGLLTAAVAHSRWVVLTPLLWILFGLSANTLTWVAGNVLSKQPDAWVSAVLPGWIYPAIPLVWALAGLTLTGAIRIVSRHLRF
ncbi:MULTISPECIES: ABC transporter permease subunit [Bacillales]|jgi:ABC-type transport system involved in multi-copper enzyme maturation permease subunit|uniref:ABC transporter permease n=1 Tax=Brevibacillus aydinogluensis TaxID=927786 RepID=A0AA48RCV8_9BACL|nr:MULTISPECIES: ABC transporter permease subunit [Bacillales]MBR8659371.1 ABC transporter permease subunit [Brevibacillus sp. NL20B1]MDT3414466.1 ABC-type transport system involved in multi-copper enzyme maturation permease subunit [Brevibacillus aydinogluensis]UFJ60051.1 ABC transporter permease subunit [Anoxybacillus sediminis]CAJ1003316.1 ABC transporter permease [Brevibacillus aydinogluensis]